MAQAKVFGKLFRKERIKQAQTVQMVATACGTSRSYITLIENGRRLPGKKILGKLAAALQIESTIVHTWYLKDIHQQLLTIQSPESSP